MRIAYALLDPGIGVFGTKGASVHVQEVIRALRADGHHVTVFCTRVNDDGPADLADLEVRRHRLPTGSGAEREQAVAAASVAIAEEIAAGDFDLVYERYSLFSDTAARLTRPAAPGARAIPSILEVNAPLIAEQRWNGADRGGDRGQSRREVLVDLQRREVVLPGRVGGGRDVELVEDIRHQLGGDGTAEADSACDAELGGELLELLLLRAGAADVQAQARAGAGQRPQQHVRAVPGLEGAHEAHGHRGIRRAI